MIKRICCGALEANSYLILPEGRPDAALIDAGDDLCALREAITASGRALTDIFLTHGHYDHIASAAALQRETGARVWIHALDAPYLKDDRLNLRAFCEAATDDERIAEASLLGERANACGAQIRVLHTPGHTPGGVCYLCASEDALFTGDTLFVGGYGRVDFPGGDAEALWRSLRELIALPRGHLTVYAGHGDSAPFDAIL